MSVGYATGILSAIQEVGREKSSMYVMMDQVQPATMNCSLDCTLSTVRYLFVPPRPNIPPAGPSITDGKCQTSLPVTLSGWYRNRKFHPYFYVEAM